MMYRQSVNYSQLTCHSALCTKDRGHSITGYVFFLCVCVRVHIKPPIPLDFQVLTYSFYTFTSLVLPVTLKKFRVWFTQV